MKSGFVRLIALLLVLTMVFPSACAADTVRIPVIWDSWPYGTGVKGTLEFPDVAEGGTRDFLYVLLRDEAGTKFISVSTEAAVDELDGSIGMKILRTLRPVQ